MNTVFTMYRYHNKSQIDNYTVKFFIFLFKSIGIIVTLILKLFIMDVLFMLKKKSISVCK